eukprot:634882-Amphidinium_carterae.1
MTIICALHVVASQLSDGHAHAQVFKQLVSMIPKAFEVAGLALHNLVSCQRFQDNGGWAIVIVLCCLSLGIGMACGCTCGCLTALTWSSYGFGRGTELSDRVRWVRGGVPSADAAEEGDPCSVCIRDRRGSARAREPVLGSDSRWRRVSGGDSDTSLEG